MTKWLREFRLIPVMLIAAGCLLALKTIGLFADGGYTLGQRLANTNSMTVTTVQVPSPQQMRSPSVPLEVAGQAQGGKQSWMQEMFNYPDITGSVAAKPKEPAKEGAAEDKDAKKVVPTQPPPDTKPAGTVIPMDQARPASAAERALLERLQERRQELDSRARELDMRESLLKAAETKQEQGAGVPKEGETKDGAPGPRKESPEAARMKSVVTMYETMKPKEAAKIFDRLDIRVLLEMATMINPRQMSAILAQMTPENAERLTIELATRTGSDRTINPSTLPKIEGKPDGG